MCHRFALLGETSRPTFISKVSNGAKIRNRYKSFLFSYLYNFQFCVLFNTSIDPLCIIWGCSFANKGHNSSADFFKNQLFF